MLVGEIFQDSRTLRQAKITILKHWHQPVGIERCIRLLIVGALEDIDQLLITFDVVLGMSSRTGRLAVDTGCI
jgi:hypothetical protein